MPNYNYPGVYVEEVSSVSQPIPGVGTSTAGFIGKVQDNVRMPDRAEVSPVNPQNPADLTKTYPLAEKDNPQFITNWAEFEKNFGYIQQGNKVLANSVFGFFTNGGTRCWVARVTELTEQNVKSALTNFEAKDEISIVAVPIPPNQPNGVVTAINITEGGSGYTDVPTVTITQPPSTGTQATATATLKDGVVTAINITEGGSGYTDVPTVTIAQAPGTGTQATATATLAPNPDEYKKIREAVLAHCEKMKDRFAILDGKDVTEDLTPENIYSGASDYGAVYFPYLKVRIKVLKAEPVNEYEDEEVDMPPSGYIAGIYARVDANRGVFKAPANEVIRGVLAKKQRAFSRDKQGELNEKNINVIRQLNGNVTVWGARTISAKSEYRYISVRRTMLFLRESIDDGTQWAVFEPNTTALWQKIIRNVSDFLLVQWRSGALFGNTRQEAFYVKCDAETNPPEERALGKVIAEVGVSIVRPAEFVIFRLSQTTLPS